MKLVRARDLAELFVVLFPRLTLQIRRRLTRGRFKSRFNTTALALTQFAMEPASRQRARGVKFEGRDHLDAALARGNGAILWTVSFGHPVLAHVALIERGISIVQVHGAAHGGSDSWFGQAVVRPIHRRIEASLFEEIIDIDQQSLAYLRRVVDRLKQNKVVSIRATGTMGNKFVAVCFRGEVRHFPTGALTLARQTGAALIPMYCFNDGGQTRLVLSPPLPVREADRGDAGLVQLAERYVAELASYVEKYPAQWWGWPVLPAGTDRVTVLHGEGAALQR